MGPILRLCQLYTVEHFTDCIKMALDVVSDQREPQINQFSPSENTFHEIFRSSSIIISFWCLLEMLHFRHWKHNQDDIISEVFFS